MPHQVVARRPMPVVVASRPTVRRAIAQAPLRYAAIFAVVNALWLASAYACHVI